jgi:sec-independent protein translocase protein TatA
MFRSFGVPEIILILVIVLIFFGVGKLPQVGSAIGKGLRSFKRGQQGLEDELEAPEEEAEVAKPAAKKTVAKKTTRKKKDEL